MTPQERIEALLNGERVDRTPVIGWPSNTPEADLKVCPADLLASSPPDSESPILAQVPNLYRHFEQAGVDIVGQLSSNPAEAETLMDEAQSQNMSLCKEAIRRGAAGVFYEVHGADAGLCTPMQYGGIFLERDRAFLEAFQDAPFNAVYVHGKEPYLDFVSDLPAKVFCWDIKGSGIPVDAVRKIRPGLLGADDPAADIQVGASEPVTQMMNLMTAGAHV